MIDSHNVWIYIFWSKAKASIYCHILCNWSLKTAEWACASLLCHIVPMALSCLIKEEKPSYYQWYQRPLLKHNIMLYLSQLYYCFSSIIKTTGSLLQRKREIVLAVSWSVTQRSIRARTHTNTNSVCVHRGQSTSTVLFLHFRPWFGGTLGLR